MTITSEIIHAVRADQEFGDQPFRHTRELPIAKHFLGVCGREWKATRLLTPPMAADLCRDRAPAWEAGSAVCTRKSAPQSQRCGSGLLCWMPSPHCWHSPAGASHARMHACTGQAVARQGSVSAFTQTLNTSTSTMAASTFAFVVSLERSQAKVPTRNPGIRFCGNPGPPMSARCDACQRPTNLPSGVIMQDRPATKLPSGQSVVPEPPLTKDPFGVSWGS